MEFAAIVYLVGTVFPLLNGVGAFIIVMLCFAAGVLFITGPLWFYEEDNSKEYVIKNGKFLIAWTLPVAFICLLAPNKEVSYTMIAAYTAQSIGENEKVQNIAGQSLEVIEAFLEKTKAELETKDVEK